MISKRRRWITKGLGVLITLSFLMVPAFGGSNWGISLGGGGLGFSYGGYGHHGYNRGYGGYGYGGGYYGSGMYSNNYYYQPTPYYQTTPYYQQYDAYPTYRPYNPVVRREVRTDGEYAPDGTFHSDTTVEDSRASSTSPGRNTAITPPRTTTQRVYGPDGTWVNRERTTWIGADGRPHSTTVDQQTTQDVWGNTHTDTNVTLKRKEASQTP